MVLGPQQDFEDAAGGGATHGVDAFRQRILLADHTIDVDCLLLQQIQRRAEASTTRSNDRDLINNDRRGVDLRLSVKCRLQNELATRTQQLECEAKTRRRA